MSELSISYVRSELRLSLHQYVKLLHISYILSMIFPIVFDIE